jgi:hypothetical protein
MRTEARIMAKTANAFRNSVTKSNPPAGFSPALDALWWAAKGDWERAHTIVMAHEDRDCAWVHAYLHRYEGDLPNARWWYGQARRPVATAPLESEWCAMVQALLNED